MKKRPFLLLTITISLAISGVGASAHDGYRRMAPQDRENLRRDLQQQGYQRRPPPSGHGYRSTEGPDSPERFPHRHDRQRQDPSSDRRMSEQDRDDLHNLLRQRRHQPQQHRR